MLPPISEVSTLAVSLRYETCDMNEFSPMYYRRDWRYLTLFWINDLGHRRLNECIVFLAELLGKNSCMLAVLVLPDPV